MKAKKALKRLTRVEQLLSGVLDQYSVIGQSAKDLLVSARGSVGRAKEALSLQPAESSPTESLSAKPSPKGQKSHLTAEGRKKLSLAAKKRWAAAKRKGVHAVTGRPLIKTA